jgi:ribosomal protein S15
VERKAALAAIRAMQAADPVHGRPTPFLQSLDSVPSPLPSRDSVLSGAAKEPTPEQVPLNHFLNPQELQEFVRSSRELNAPRKAYDGDMEKERAFQLRHERTLEAIKRIVQLGNGSSSDRTRSNKQTCIDLFGRHNTDKTLPKDPGAPTPEETGKTPRAGPDTGSSEVQAAILTVKIKALAKALHRSDGHNTKDKHNKRNLRLMVHRRQKLLKYLKRKEKGGIRYRNIIAALGLDEDAVHKELFL